MFTISMKNKFCDSSFEIFEEPRISSMVRSYQISPLSLAVVDPSHEVLIEVNVVRIIYDGDAEVSHTLPMIAKTYYTLSIRSQRDSSNMKRCPSVLPQTILCSTTTKGLMAVKIQPTRKKPPHRFDPIIPYWAFNTRTRGLVRAQFL